MVITFRPADLGGTFFFFKSYFGVCLFVCLFVCMNSECFATLVHFITEKAGVVAPLGVYILM